MDNSYLESLKTNEEKEREILQYCDSKIKEGNYEDLLSTTINLQNIWKDLTTARLTKIVKCTFDMIPINFKTYEGILFFLDGLVKWACDKKMLKLDLECKQIHVYLNIGKYTECLDKISKVSKDLKKYDDKPNLISLYVYESRAYYELKDFSKARSSLTSARALAVSAACPIQLQAQIDLLNGMYISDEHSYETAISYFIEAVEGFVQERAYENAKVALRYIILNKIMSCKINEVSIVLESKYASKIKDDEYVELLLKVGNICKKRDLKMYKDLLSSNVCLIETDAFIYRHLQYLYNILLDRNILKIIEPYSHIKVLFIAQKLNFDESIIEDKLRKMILDKSIDGILDHVSQCLILHTSIRDCQIPSAINTLYSFLTKEIK